VTTRRLLLVTWEDPWTHGEAGWKAEEKVRKMGPAVGRSVGWEIRRTKKYVILAAHQLEDQLDGELRIPVGVILSEVELAPKPK
jgi:hypothetical protein